MEQEQNQEGMLDNLEKVRERVLLELEDAVTDPSNPRDIDIETFELMKKGYKVPFHKEIDSLVCRIGQDMRIDPIQLHAIREEFFLN